MWDTHLHSYFSADCETDPESNIIAAIDKGLQGICFTEHLELDFPDPNTDWNLDTDAYFTKISELKDKYKDKLEIGIGLELGMQPYLVKRIEAITAAKDYDFILCSTHTLKNIDIYNEFPLLKSDEEEAASYRAYFELCYENICKCKDYDSAAHLDYAVRYGPNKNRYYSLEKYEDIITAILEELIKRDKSLEINTSGFKSGLNAPNPCYDVLKKYYELGGRLVTTGSDAHFSEYIAYKFSEIREMLKEIGFDSYTCYKKRTPILCPL